MLTRDAGAQSIWSFGKETANETEGTESQSELRACNHWRTAMAPAWSDPEAAVFKNDSREIGGLRFLQSAWKNVIDFPYTLALMWSYLQSFCRKSELTNAIPSFPDLYGRFMSVSCAS
jgi:hypothetical protein